MNTAPPSDRTARQEWLRSLALQALIYAWPVYEMRRMRAATSPRKVPELGFAGDGPDSSLRWCNTFTHTRALLRAGTSRVVMPNNDTLYTNAWLDLSAQALVISVPEMAERYYVLGFLDFFTNPFAHVGTRTTGQRAGRVLVTGPGWTGQLPDEFARDGHHIASPTDWVWIIGRILVDGEPDIERVVALQAGFQIQTLSDFQAERASPPRRFDACCDPGAPPSALHVLDQINAGLSDNPAPPADQALLASFAPLGVGLPREAAHLTMDQPEVRQAWEAALDTARRLLDGHRHEVLPGLGAGGDGWSSATLVPLDGFGHDHLLRAFVSRQSIGALVPQEAAYPRCDTDASGEPLHGAQRYRLRFAPDQLPPVTAFWSITLYSMRDYMLVDNPIDRYAIGDRTPGLVRDPDGGLTIWISHNAPLDESARANWLPCPADAFFLCLRAYLPRAELLDGRYQLPVPEVSA